MKKSIESDHVVNHYEEVVVINEVPVGVVPVQVYDSVIVDGVVDPHAVVVKVDPVQGRSSTKGKYLPLASLLIIGILGASGSTAAAITIGASSEIADHAIGKTILTDGINHIPTSKSEIPDLSRTNIPQIINGNQIYGLAKIGK
jgi:hypothetical protein